MKIECKNCGSTYSIDERKLPAGTAKFRCRKCQTFLYVKSDSEETSSNSQIGIKDCPKCGNILKMNIKECPKCGVVVEKYNDYIQKKLNAEKEAAVKDREIQNQESSDDPVEQIELDENNMYCASCGHKISIKDNFCRKCGNSLSTISEKDSNTKSVGANENDPKRKRPNNTILAIGVVIAGILFLTFCNHLLDGPKRQSSMRTRSIGQLVTEYEFGDDWAFTVDEGYVYSKNKAAIFNSGGVEYQLNGLAKARGYRSIDPIWRDNPDIPGTKINIGPYIRLALKNPR